jgi:hypothetical protein
MKKVVIAGISGGVVNFLEKHFDLSLWQALLAVALITGLLYVIIYEIVCLVRNKSLKEV